MTEEEAKTKWCPHVVASHTDPRQPPSQYEREAGATSPFRHNCIGSACMAWRWKRGPVEARPARPAYDEESGKHYDIPARKAAPGDGFCGLAGQP